MAIGQSRSLNWSPSVPAWRQMELWRQKQSARTQDAIANTAVLSDSLGAAMVNQSAGMGDILSRIAVARLQAKPDNAAVIDKLRAFVAVVETGSYTEASKSLGKTESAITKHVQQLESQLGRPLFVRGASTQKLTVDGQKMLFYARDILSA
jgi:Bacterial regulatory helix-turn-helix protein, lysR family